MKTKGWGRGFVSLSFLHERLAVEALSLSLYSVNEVILLCNSVLTEVAFDMLSIVFFSLLLSQYYTFVNK